MIYQIYVQLVDLDRKETVKDKEKHEFKVKLNMTLEMTREQKERNMEHAKHIMENMPNFLWLGQP